MKAGVRNAVRLVILLTMAPVLLIIFLVIAAGICWTPFRDTMKDLLVSWRDGLTSHEFRAISYCKMLQGMGNL